MATELLSEPDSAERALPGETALATPQDNGAPRRVLAIFAHPDDVEFTCGGSIARWADAGTEIAYVVCTDGSKGGDWVESDDAEVRAIREAEQRSAAVALGVDEIAFLRHPDGALDQAADLKRELVEVIRRWRPGRLLAWDPWRRYQLHPDHRAAGIAAVDAVLAAANPRMYREQLERGLAPHRVGEIYLFGSDQPDVWVNVSETFERKLMAISAHRSQTEQQVGLAEAMRQCNEEHGKACGCAYAERFKVLRPFCDT